MTSLTIRDRSIPWVSETLIDFDGVRYAWKYTPADSDAGSYQRVVRAGAQLPDGGETFRIKIPWEKFVIGRDTDARRAYMDLSR